MVIEECLVDPLAATEAFGRTVPEFDVLFAQFPAETDFFTAVKGREVDQSNVEILDFEANLSDLVENLFQAGAGGVDTGAEAGVLVAVDIHAAHHGNLAIDTIDLFARPVVLLLQLQGLAQKAVGGRNELARLIESEIARHCEQF